MSYLSIRGVAKEFPGRKGAYHALQDVNLEVQQGEFVCLIGHSGCGKSTLLNLIGCLDMPTGGRLTLEGQEIKNPGAERGMVFQHHALLPWLSVYDNVHEAVSAVYRDEYANEKRTRVDRYLDLVG